MYVNLRLGQKAETALVIVNIGKRKAYPCVHLMVFNSWTAILPQLIPLHPLTIEDILAQETREKIESHEALGYYFVAFRALDETYFRYSAVSPSSASTMSASTTMSSTHRGRPNGPFQPGQPANTMGQSKSSSELSEKTGLQHRSTGRNSSEKQRARDDDDNQTLSGKPKKWKVEIVEGAKEGVEGVGVGAVNVYMVVFGDGIITVSADIASIECYWPMGRSC